MRYLSTIHAWAYQASPSHVPDVIVASNGARPEAIKAELGAMCRDIRQRVIQLSGCLRQANDDADSALVPLYEGFCCLLRHPLPTKVVLKAIEDDVERLEDVWLVEVEPERNPAKRSRVR